MLVARGYRSDNKREDTVCTGWATCRIQCGDEPSGRGKPRPYRRRAANDKTRGETGISGKALRRLVCLDTLKDHDGDLAAGLRLLGGEPGDDLGLTGKQLLAVRALGGAGTRLEPLAG